MADETNRDDVVENTEREGQTEAKPGPVPPDLPGGAARGIPTEVDLPAMTEADIRRRETVPPTAMASSPGSVPETEASERNMPAWAASASDSPADFGVPTEAGGPETGHNSLSREEAGRVLDLSAVLEDTNLDAGSASSGQNRWDERRTPSIPSDDAKGDDVLVVYELPDAAGPGAQPSVDFSPSHRQETVPLPGREHLEAIWSHGEQAGAERRHTEPELLGRQLEPWREHLAPWNERTGSSRGRGRNRRVWRSILLFVLGFACALLLLHTLQKDETPEDGAPALAVTDDAEESTLSEETISGPRASGLAPVLSEEPGAAQDSEETAIGPESAPDTGEDTSLEGVLVPASAPSEEGVTEEGVGGDALAEGAEAEEVLEAEEATSAEVPEGSAPSDSEEPEGAKIIQIRIKVGLNLREEPSLEGAAHTSIRRGQTVQVLGRHPGSEFLLVESGDKHGWIAGRTRFVERVDGGALSDIPVLAERDETAAEVTGEAAAEVTGEVVAEATGDMEAEATADAASESPPATEEAGADSGLNEVKTGEGEPAPESLQVDETGRPPAPVGAVNAAGVYPNGFPVLATVALSLRRAPNPRSIKVGVLPRGRIAYAIGRVAGSHYIKLRRGGRTGWAIATNSVEVWSTSTDRGMLVPPSGLNFTQLPVIEGAP